MTTKSSHCERAIKVSSRGAAGDVAISDVYKAEITTRQPPQKIPVMLPLVMTSLCLLLSSTFSLASPKKILFYRNPMNPAITSPVPAKDNMGMDYIPVYAEEAATSVPGQGVVEISPDRQQAIGIKISTIERRELFVPIRTSAHVAYDPALYNAIVEYREALAAQQRAHESRAPQEFQTENTETVQAAKLRLRQMGLSEDQMGNLNSMPSDPAELLLGKPGRAVWVYADIYDSEAALVKTGQRVELSAAAYPGKRFAGTVCAVDTIINPETRTLRARITAPNPDGLLKPEMYLDAIIKTGLGRRIAVLETSVLHTGTRDLVFVETEPGRFSPRVVTLGRQAGNYYEVISGLQKGEKVSTSGNFLLDSESKLRATSQ
jgi:Cu(I)/Ag(I) efflux system membrane fusion protein